MKTLGIAMLSVLLLSGCKDKRDCTPEEQISRGKVIAEVGGCDRNGYCGVSFEDGTFGTARFPVKGFRVYPTHFADMVDFCKVDVD